MKMARAGVASVGARRHGAAAFEVDTVPPVDLLLSKARREQQGRGGEECGRSHGATPLRAFLAALAETDHSLAQYRWSRGRSDPGDHRVRGSFSPGRLARRGR